MNGKLFDDNATISENRKALQRIIARGVASGVVIGLLLFSLLFAIVFVGASVYYNDAKHMREAGVRSWLFP